MIQSFMPVTDGKFIDFKAVFEQILKEHIDELVYGAFHATEAFDLANAKKIAKNIEENPGKYRLITQYLGSIDHAAHVGNRNHVYMDYKMLMNQ